MFVGTTMAAPTELAGENGVNKRQDSSGRIGDDNIQENVNAVSTVISLIRILSGINS